jgi:hypothetical protein
MVEGRLKGRGGGSLIKMRTSYILGKHRYLWRHVGKWSSWSLPQAEEAYGFLWTVLACKRASDNDADWTLAFFTILISNRSG